MTSGLLVLKFLLKMPQRQTIDLWEQVVSCSNLAYPAATMTPEAFQLTAEMSSLSSFSKFYNVCSSLDSRLKDCPCSRPNPDSDDRYSSTKASLRLVLFPSEAWFSSESVRPSSPDRQWVQVLSSHYSDIHCFSEDLLRCPFEWGKEWLASRLMFSLSYESMSRPSYLAF